MTNSNSIVIYQPIGEFIGNHHYVEQVGTLWAGQVYSVNIISDYTGSRLGECYFPVFNRVFKTKYRIIKFFKLFIAILQSVKIIIRLKPDLLNIHIFDVQIRDVVILALVKAFTNVKVLTTVHDVSNISGQGPFDFLISFLKPAFFKYVDFFNVHTAYAESELKTYFIEKKIRHTENFLLFPAPDYLGKDCGYHATKACQRRSRKINFLVFGQIKSSKRLDLVVEAFWRLRHRDDLCLTIRGKLRDFQIERYQAKLDELRHSGRCDYEFGFIDEKSLDDVFSKTDVAILPYDHIYNSGVLINLLARSIPCLTSDHPIFLASSDYGYLNMVHERGDVNDLVRRIEEFIYYGNVAYAQKKASEIFDKLFSPRAVAREFQNSYEKVFL